VARADYLSTKHIDDIWVRYFEAEHHPVGSSSQRRSLRSPEVVPGQSPPTPPAMRSPVSLSLLRRYSKALSSTGPDTLCLGCPTTLETRRSRWASSDVAHQGARLAPVVAAPVKRGGASTNSPSASHFSR
jgi:hypothetical protein